MVLSDHWLIENNYKALRFDMSARCISAPGDNEERINASYEGKTWEEMMGILKNIGATGNKPCTGLQGKVYDVLMDSPGHHYTWDELVRGQRICFSITLTKHACRPIIYPFYEESINIGLGGRKVPSYGLSSAGYDVTLEPKFKIFTNINSGVIDPMDFDESNCVEFKGDSCIIPPNSYLLGVTREYFCIPKDVMVICLGKSTWARAGAIVNVTPIEPGFEGNVVIEISNATPSPLRIHANCGIAQFIFHQMDRPAKTSYADRKGKYQNQTGITLAKV